MTFCDKLQILRKSKGFTQEGLSEKLNVSRAAVAKWEAGQEAVWKNGKAVYAMNYAGRVLDQKFSGNFLKEALRATNKSLPFRGPEIYQSGEYTYKTTVTGDINWFQGYEEIFCNETKVYECYYHGGLMK